jgi:hypothetical protein
MRNKDFCCYHALRSKYVILQCCNCILMLGQKQFFKGCLFHYRNFQQKMLEKEAANLPWVEKYRPNALDELISHEEIISTIK